MQCSGSEPAVPFWF